MRNNNDVSNGVFELVTHPVTEQCAMIYLPDYEIRIHQQSDLTTLVNILSVISPSDKTALSNYIKSVSKFKFKDIIPQNITTFEFEHLENEGYFSEPTN